MKENVKTLVNETVNKIKENDTVASTVEKISENEYVKKVKQSKHFNLIKIGAIIIAALLIFNVFKVIFGDGNAKKAEKFVRSDIVSAFEGAGIDDYKIKTEIIEKNKGSNIYAIDVVVKGTKPNGEKSTSMQFVLVYSNAGNVYAVNGYDYQKENKKDIKDVVLALLAKG